MYYRLLDNHGKVTEELLRSFSDLPPDEYLKSAVCFRYRAFSEAEVKGDTVQWTGERPFFQSTDINGYAGGVTRTFAPLTPAAKQFAEDLLADRRLRSLVGEEELTVGCHQIRITADDTFNGYPAPEGFHHDGFDFVAVTCIAQDNVSGGVSLVSLADSDANDEIILDYVLHPGETVLLDDKRVRHYVSPITPRTPGSASRDVIVVTISSSTHGGTSPVAPR